jgi:hypothetical protein
VSAVLEKVRAAILPGGKPDDAALVAELARLHSRFVEIDRSNERLLSALKGVHTRERAAYRAFEKACASDDPQSIEAALNEWLVLAPQSEFAEREFAAAHAMRNFGSVMTRFKSEFPNAKDLLRQVCELRLAQAKEQARVVLAEERARLSPEGFSESEIANSTRAKRATARVKHLEIVRRRIGNEPIESTWKIFAGQLLQT